MEAQADLRVPSRGRSFPPRLTVLGDERLARLVGGGSERAFTALYERYHQALYRYCLSMLRNDADAQDALQATFTGALVALRRGQRNAPLRPWLYRIAHNESISLLRRRRSEDELSEASEPATASVADVAEERARLDLLMADLRELPERQRGALVMRELGGLSHEEVALALGITVGAAKQTVFEARRSLMEFSEGRAMACEEIRRTISDGDGRALRGRRIRAHLRDCPGCAAFAAAIPARTAELRALAPLPAVAAAGLLARIAGVGSGHGAAGAGGAVAAGAGKSVGMALSAKALTGVAVIATAAAGVTAVLHHSGHPARTSAPTHAIRSGPGRPAARTPPGSGGPGGPAAGRRRAKRSGASSKHRAKRARRRTASRPAASSFAAIARRAQARSLPQARVRPSRGSAHENHGHQKSRAGKHEKHKKHKPDKKHERRHVKWDARKRDRARHDRADAGKGWRAGHELRTGGTP